jgi:hypothetical protein
VRAVWQWLLVQSVPVKMVLGLVVLALSVALSPLLALVAYLAFFVCLVVAVFQAFRRRPSMTWGIAVLSSFVLMLAFSGISNAVYGPASSPPQERAATPEKAEEPPPKATQEAAAKPEEKAEPQAK